MSAEAIAMEILPEGKVVPGLRLMRELALKYTYCGIDCNCNPKYFRHSEGFQFIKCFIGVPETNTYYAAVEVYSLDTPSKTFASREPMDKAKVSKWMAVEN